MQTVLNHLNSVPGVVGSLVCNSEGRVLAQVFPPLFDEGLLKEAATALADSAVGLEVMTGSVGLLDFRFAEARVVVKPFQGALLLVLCTKVVNVQLLVISASVAVNKLTKLVQAAPVAEEKKKQKPAKPAPKWWPSM